MKLSIIFLFLITQFAAFGQFPRDKETGKVVYTDVIELPQTEKKVVYEKAKLWIVTTLKSGDNMVELEGSNSDQIIGTGNLVLDSIHINPNTDKGLMPDASLNFKFAVFCKDNKVKYSVENFLMSTLYGGVYHKSSLEDVKPFYNMFAKAEKKWIPLTSAYLDRQIKALVADFERAMKTEKDNDW